MNEFDERPRRRAAQKAATREAVLAAARAEFERVGFDEANVRAIARAAGVSAGTVLHYFEDKRVLLYAALFEELERTLRAAAGEVGRPPLARQLDRLAAQVFAYYRQRPGLSRTLLKEALFADPPWAAAFAAQTGRVHADVAALTTQALSRGELREDTRVEVVAAAFLAFFYFGLISWAQGAHPSPETLVSALMQQHLAGLRTPPSPNRKRARR